MQKLLAVSACVSLISCGTYPHSGGEIEAHTFSIVALDPETGDFGVAVATYPRAVGSMVPFAKADVGAVATQAFVNPSLGPAVLKLLEKGKAPKDSLEEALSTDGQKEQRQLGCVDKSGNSYAFTGKKCIEYCGSRTGKGYSIQGNMLKNEDTLIEFEKAFLKDEEDGSLIAFPQRLLNGLAAAQKAGGDYRGHRSAAILVVRKNSMGKGDYDRLVDLRIDDNESPVEALQKLYSDTSAERGQAYPKSRAFWAAAAKAEITPDKNAFMAGFDPNRMSEKVHDALWTRTLVIKSGMQTLLISSVDLIGVPNSYTRMIRKTIADKTGIPIENTIVCSTHNHSGPDTIGLWGRPPLQTGFDLNYFKLLHDKVVETAVQASTSLKKVTLSYGEFDCDEYIKDSRDPVVRDPTGRFVAFKSGKKPIALLTNVSVHPEGIGRKNKEITSDYNHYFCERIEREFDGCIVVQTSGVIGGMQTPKLKGNGFDGLEDMGKTLAERVISAITASKKIRESRIAIQNSRISFRLENKMFQAALQAGMIPAPKDAFELKDGTCTIFSEITVASIGGLTIATVPGEVFPELNPKIRALLPGTDKIILGLANDEVGYIMPDDSWTDGKYEESMSLGRNTGSTLLKSFEDLSGF